MTRTIILYALMIIGLSCFSPALADKGGNGHGKGHEKAEKHGKHSKDHGHSDKHGGAVIIDASDGMIIRQYIARDYRSHCPPGLAKKNNGCLPPGQAKKQYVIGQPLLIAWQPVPQPLLVQLHPVPAGYQYVMVDKDVLLISEASHHVIDAITLMSAVGK